jgi:hypothetical protein
MKRKEGRSSDIFPLLRSDGLLVSLEELEARLETQIAGLSGTLDDDHCLYYLCTTRCSGTKCPVFSPALS